ncbi:prevent-host-death family protein [Actinomadura rubrisoli]|uniref:Prevent-host-death family protein n=1 Tax=Actinomadura rubrisoli TaxID=2530368 RepID=A0A4R5B455_9ACTN|nr:prevent-host-death family protein [Actinomadura rubrisoli]
MDLTEQVDAEEAQALAQYRAQQEAGAVTSVPQDEVRRRFGLNVGRVA